MFLMWCQNCLRKTISLVGVCTEGAPVMLASRSGFVTKIKQKSPSAVGIDCVIHREALAARNLPVELRIHSIM